MFLISEILYFRTQTVQLTNYLKYLRLASKTTLIHIRVWNVWFQALFSCFAVVFVPKMRRKMGLTSLVGIWLQVGFSVLNTSVWYSTKRASESTPSINSTMMPGAPFLCLLRINFWSVKQGEGIRDWSHWWCRWALPYLSSRSTFLWLVLLNARADQQPVWQSMPVLYHLLVSPRLPDWWRRYVWENVVLCLVCLHLQAADGIVCGIRWA